MEYGKESTTVYLHWIITGSGTRQLSGAFFDKNKAERYANGNGVIEEIEVI